VDSLLAMLGTLFFLFLILAAAVEVILEMFRGLLEWLGITWIKGKISLEDSLKLADGFAKDEFAQVDSNLKIKLQAIKTAADQISGKIKDKIDTLEKIKAKLGGVGVDLSVVSSELSDVALSIRAELEKSERGRVFVLRTLAAIVGCALVWMSKFYVFQILAKSSGAQEFMAGIGGGFASDNSPGAIAINVIVGGLAAAAGSSYWHDQLDRVRSLKAVAQELKKLGT